MNWFYDLNNEPDAAFTHLKFFVPFSSLCQSFSITTVNIPSPPFNQIIKPFPRQFTQPQTKNLTLKGRWHGFDWPTDRLMCLLVNFATQKLIKKEIQLSEAKETE